MLFPPSLTRFLLQEAYHNRGESSQHAVRPLTPCLTHRRRLAHAEREKVACSLARLLARRGAARMHLKEYESAHKDCQEAAGLYSEVGQVKQAQALEADLLKLAALLPHE